MGKHPRVVALIKSIFNQNPPKPTYFFIWDVEHILKFLSSLPNGNSICHKLLTYMWTMLLALTSASRASEICHLNIEYMVKTTSG